jgi:hypothetical protein
MVVNRGYISRRTYWFYLNAGGDGHDLGLKFAGLDAITTFDDLPSCDLAVSLRRVFPIGKLPVY